MTKTLEERIEERATDFAKTFGTGFWGYSGGQKKSGYYYFGGNFEISHDTFYLDYGFDFAGSTIEIKYKEEIVFFKGEYKEEIVFLKSEQTIETYIPGAWERELDQLYEKLTDIRKSFQEKAAKFGL